MKLQEDWKYAKHQLTLFTTLCLIFGLILFTYGSIVMFVMPLPKVVQSFNVKCRLDPSDSPSVWHVHGIGAELFVSAHMILTMTYITCYYIVFWIIPFRHNQIEKTEKEVSDSSLNGMVVGK